MSLRLRDENNERDPTYDAESDYFTVKFHVEGVFVHSPHAMYSGGKIHIYDYVELSDVSLLYLDVLCELAGVYGFKRYHRIKDNKFLLVRTDRAMHGYLEESGGVVDLYVEVDMNLLIQSQMGSSSGMQVDGEKDDDYVLEPGEDNAAESGDEDVIEAEDDLFQKENYPSDSDDQVSVELNEPPNDVPEHEVNNEQVDEDGNEQGNGNGNDELNGESDSGSSDLGESLDELPSLHGSEDEDDARTTHDIFNAKRDMNDPYLYCGLKFTDLKEFKEAVRNFSIKRGRPVKFAKSERTRCRVKCKKVGCQWSVYAAVIGDSGKAEIRTYNPTHKCSYSYRNPNVKSTWLAKRYLTDFVHDPKSNMTNFRKRMMHEVKCQISKSTAYRARKKALEMIRGSQEDQYALIWDYIEEIKRTDKGATVILKTGIQTTDEVDIQTQEALMGENIPAIIDSPRFQRLYFCLAAPKYGMKHGCRRIFGLDGCHLKGMYGGMLLTAVGIDPNNNLYPIAYAAVEGENKDSWTWFLDLLRDDLGIERDDDWTIVSDKQKGLIQACDLVFPAAVHRFCLRHLHANWAVAGYTGKTLKDALYNAACATTVSEFEKAMYKLASIDKNAADWLEDKPPAHWSRSHFGLKPKCDMLLNNLCESFNSVILDARYLPILSMFEWIRTYLMVRFQENRERAMTHWLGKKICPKIKRRLQKNMEEGAEYIPQRADTNKYECHGYRGDQFVVNLAERTCSCRKWELTGIPCAHACCALGMAMKEPEDYVDDCYRVKTYLDVYSLAIEPVSGLKQLRKTGNDRVLPPLFKSQPGRPKKARKKSKGEDLLISKNPKQKQKLRRVGLPCVCSICKKAGHNKRRCPEVIGSQSAAQPTKHAAPAGGHQPKVQKKRKSPQTKNPSEKRRVTELNENQSASTHVVAAVEAPTVVQSQNGTVGSKIARSNANHVVHTSPNVELSQSASLPAGLPNFWIKNGKKYVPRSMLHEAMAMMKKKPSGSASK